MFVCPECGLVAGQPGHCTTDGTALAARGDDAIVGTTLGPYRVARLLGVGGMGRVYKGVHPGIGSRVAIKVLSYECAQRQDLVERFFSEARAVNLIRHESIVNVLDLAMLPDGRPYIIMEYLDGAPLADIIKKAGGLPLGSLARLAAEVLDALGAAHAKNIVHRDLKPDNIYVTPAGHPKVLDFGIAKLQQNVSGMGSATQTGSLLGTPHYMSPEQAMGRNVDLRTDIYAMGVILYECATGRRPFEAESLYDLLRQHIESTPMPPRAMRPDMPPAYEAVILATLAKDPNQRPQSCAQLSSALQQATQGIGPEGWVPVTPGTASQLAAQRTPSWGTTQQSWPGGSAPGQTPVPPTDPGAGRGMGGYPGTPVPGPGQMTPPMMMNAPSTATAGQVITQPPAKGSGKGLWIGLFVAAVVIGGGSAAYFATRGGGGGGETAAATQPQPQQEVAQQDPPPAPKPDQPPKPDDPAPKPADPPPDSPPQQQTGSTMITTGTGTGTGTGSGTGSASSNTAYPLPTGASFTGPVPMPLPSNWNPKAFDVSGYYKTAEDAAKQVWPDVQLVRIDADGVRPNGMSELTLDDEYYVRYWFKSEKQRKPPADQPIGAKNKQVFNLQVWVSKDGIDIQPMDWDDDEDAVPPPKCNFKQAWDKAIKTGAPGGNAVAEMTYSSNIVSHEIQWMIQVGDAYDEQLPDGC